MGIYKIFRIKKIFFRFKIWKFIYWMERGLYRRIWRKIFI